MKDASFAPTADRRLERERAPDGGPVLRLPGTPGSRFSLRADQAPWVERGLRVITVERPGFGASTRLPGRGFVEHADDLAAILDHLGILASPCTAAAGARPMSSAFAGAPPRAGLGRARSVEGSPPLADDEVGQQVDLNAAGDRLARTGEARRCGPCSARSARRSWPIRSPGSAR